MNKIDFMRELEGLLQNISATEREEALQYYNDYFDEAGVENEEQVVRELGSPARVAANIRKELFGAGEGYTVNRNTPAAGQTAGFDETNDRAGASGYAGAHTHSGYSSFDTPYTDTATQPTPGKSGFPGWAIALIVILIIFSSPVLIGILGVLFGLLVAWFALIFSAGVVALSMFAVLIILLVVGIGCLFVSPWVGVILIGVGLVCGAVGVLFLMLTILMAGIITPAVCRGIGRLFRGRKKQA